jgi:PAS domain S-box-containing protein/putative nucleotidyltransferase with HDIG domain
MSDEEQPSCAGTSTESPALNEDMWRALVDSTSDAVVVSDHHGRIVVWNPAASRIFGTPRSDAIGAPLTDLMRVEADERERELMQTLEQRVEQRTQELGVLYELSRRLAYVRDFQELFRTILQELHSAVPHDVAAAVLRNGHTLDVYVQPARPISHTAREHVHQRLVDTWNRMAPSVPESGTQVHTHSFGLDRVDPSADPVTAIDAAFQVPIVEPGSGDLVGLLFVGAEAKEAFTEGHVRLLYTLAGQATSSIQCLRTRLVAEQERMEGLVDSLPDGVLLLDAEGRIVLANPAARRILLTLSDSGVGDIFDHLGDQPVISMLRNTQGPVRTELVVGGPPRRIFELESRSPVGADEGEGWIVLLRDVTAQRELLEAEQARRLELDALYSLARQLAAKESSESVLKSIAHHVVETVRVTFCRVVGVDEDDIYRCLAGYSVRMLGRDLGEQRREGEAAWKFYQDVLDGGLPLVLHRDDPAVDDAIRRDLYLDLAKVVCLTPLRVGTQQLGVLVLGEARGAAREPFDEHKLRLTVALADQASSALRRTELHANLEQAYLQAVLALARAMDARDEYTGDHADRLAASAEAVAQQMGCDASVIEHLRLGALLHDIGKIGVPDRILLKPAKLDAEEWTVMKRHPEVGANILAPLRQLAEVAPIVRGHHERFDGKGYPDGLMGEAIPLGARIICVVDSFGAMTDDRSYRRAMAEEEAVAELRRCAGAQFDPTVVEAFLEVLHGIPGGLPGADATVESRKMDISGTFSLADIGSLDG